jgi:hypothetical protein
MFLTASSRLSKWGSFLSLRCLTLRKDRSVPRVCSDIRVRKFRLEVKMCPNTKTARGSYEIRPYEALAGLVAGPGERLKVVHFVRHGQGTHNVEGDYRCDQVTPCKASERVRQYIIVCAASRVPLHHYLLVQLERLKFSSCSICFHMTSRSRILLYISSCLLSHIAAICCSSSM